MTGIHQQAGAATPANRSRAAYSPSEFAASCGRHPSWAYRLLYGGKIKALTDLGRILIPASELERVLATATPYNPQPRKQRVRQPLILSRGRQGVKGAVGEEESWHLVETPLSDARTPDPCDTEAGAPSSGFIQ